MATFLSRPQPGDGTWLLNRITPDAGGAGGVQMKHRQGRKKNRIFSRTARDGCGGVRSGEDQTELADAGGNIKNVLPNRDSRNRKGPSQIVDVPRTVVNEDPDLAVAATSTFAPSISGSNTTRHLPSGSANHISQKSHGMDGTSIASMGPKKSLPPHLARKQASSNEKNTPSAEANAPSWDAWTRVARSGTKRPETNNATRRRGSARGGRGGGNSFAAARAEIPKVDPNRWKTDWTGRNSWDSSSVNTRRASSGWGTKKKSGAACPPPGDWSGKLAPPPPDWDSRPGFRVDQSYKRIMDWMSEIENKMCPHSESSVSLGDVTAADGTRFVFCLVTLEPDKPPTDLAIRQMGEIVPHYWVPIVIGLQAPQVFWDELMRSAPKPDDPVDLEGAKPWWERFVKSLDSCLNFLKDAPFPTVIGIDPDQEDADQALKRKHDMGSKNFANNRRRFELERLQETVEKQRRIAEKQCKLAALKTISTAPSNRNRNCIKPGFKLYIRSARAEDMGFIKDIYNYYIENTISVPGMERCSREQMVARYGDIRLRRMPFLVACRPGVIVKALRKKKNQTNHPTRDDVQLPDTIVGFAFADDYDDSRGMYRFTAEIQFFTKETEFMNGVANCLVDRLVVLLDPTYQDRGGYEALGDDIDGLGTFRIIKNIIINLPFEKPERLEWMGRWLERWLKFKEVGLLDNIGTKDSKAVSLAIFQRKTGAVLDHGNPPSGFVPT